MSEQTAPRYKSIIADKEQNCDAFGTYEAAGSTAKFAARCHGGYYDGKFYEKCQVHAECRTALMAKNNMRAVPASTSSTGTISQKQALVTPPPQQAPTARTLEDLFKPRTFRPDWGNLRRTLPLVASIDAKAPARAAPTTTTTATSSPTTTTSAAAVPAAKVDATAAVTTVVRGPTLHGAGGGFPQIIVPAPDAPWGTRTSYATPSGFSGEFTPTFIPDEDEGIWSRLLKNIFQGILASIGWAIWNYCRTVDLFA